MMDILAIIVDSKLWYSVLICSYDLKNIYIIQEQLSKYNVVLINNLTDGYIYYLMTFEDLLCALSVLSSRQLLLLNQGQRKVQKE